MKIFSPIWINQCLFGSILVEHPFVVGDYRCAAALWVVFDAALF